MTKEEAIQVLQTALTAPFIYGEYADALNMAIEALSRPQGEQIVYCMDCAKSVPLFDERCGALYCKAHDRTTLRHSYCNNGVRRRNFFAKGGDDE